MNGIGSWWVEARGHQETEWARLTPPATVDSLLAMAKTQRWVSTEHRAAYETWARRTRPLEPVPACGELAVRVAPISGGRWLYRMHHPYYLTVYTLDPAGAGIRVLDDGREVVVMAWSATGGQLSVASDRASGLWDDTWNYRTLPGAVAAAASWGGVNEPSGWFRHPFTGRTR